MSFSKVSPCFTLPANHRQQIVYLAMPHTETNKSQATNHTSCHASHRYHQITGNKSYILPCLTQMPTNNRQQFVHLAMPHTDTSESSVKGKSSRGYELLRANHRQQIIHLVLPRTDTAKSQATNLTSCHASHRCQQIECKKKK